MTTFTASANGQTFDLNEAGDTVILGNFNDITVQSYRHNNIGFIPSDEVISFGSGTGELISTYIGDTVFGGAGSAVFDTSDSFEADYNNVYQLGNGNYSGYLGADDIVTLGNGDDTLTINNNSRLTAGNGDDAITIVSTASGGSITLGNGNNTITALSETGNQAISVGTGADKIDLEGHHSGNLSFTQALDAGVDTIDLTGANLSSFTATISNASDVIELGDARISNFTINVAVDGFKLPDGNNFENTTNLASSPTAGTVNYIATGEEIAAPYNLAQPLPYFIDKLLFSPVPHWNADLGQAVTLNFSFMQSLPSYASHGADGDATGFQSIGGDVPAGLSPSQLLADNSNSHADGVSLTGAQLSAVAALAAWESVANVDFVSVLDTDSATDEVRFGSNNQGDASGGYSYVPFPNLTGNDALEAADVYVNNDSAVEPLSDYGRVFIHEIGHVLGLGGESGNGDPYDILPGGTRNNGGGEDSALYTVMSYDNPPAGVRNAIITPQVFDIAVAQYLYGADPNFDANPSHVWTFSGSYGSTSNLIDGVGSATDVISAGTWSSAAYVDLRQGHWSWEGAKSTDILAADQLFIDYGTEVDQADAHATTGAATIVCNDNNDAIVCGSGNDLVVVGPGLDTVWGGTGDATVLFQSDMSDYTITQTGVGLYTVAALAPSEGGTDYLSNVTSLEFSDQTVSTLGPTALANLTPGQFSSLTTTALANMTATVIDGLTSTNVAALTVTQIRALSTAQIVSLAANVPNAIAALSSTDIGVLTVTVLDALGSSTIDSFTTRQMSGLTGTQLLNLPIATLASLSGTEVASLSTTQISGLNSAALHGFGASNLDAMTATQLGSLTAAQFTGLNATALAGLSAGGIAALATSVVAALSKTQIGSLTATELGALTASQLGGLATADIVALTTTQIGGLSADQLGAFSTSQIVALTTTGVGALTATQIYGLSTQEVAGLTVSQVSVLTVTQLVGLSANQLLAFTATQVGAMTAQFAAILG